MRAINIHASQPITPTIAWQRNIPEKIRGDLTQVIGEYGIRGCLVGVETKPALVSEQEDLLICLSRKCLNDLTVAAPQLRSLLLANGYQPAGTRLEIPKGTEWEFVEDIDRHVPVFKKVMSPIEPTTTLFFNLFNKINDSLMGSEILEFGTGSGALTVKLARLGPVDGIDIKQSAAQNSTLTLSCETDEVKNHVQIGESDLDSRLNEITGKEKNQYDFVIFNSPLILGEVEDEEDLDSVTGGDFSTTKRAVERLRYLLKPNGKAYYLTTCFNPDAREINCLDDLIESNSDATFYNNHIWNIHRLEEAVSKMPGWSVKLTGEEHSTTMDINSCILFTIAEVISPANH